MEFVVPSRAQGRYRNKAQFARLVGLHAVEVVAGPVLALASTFQPEKELVIYALSLGALLSLLGVLGIWSVINSGTRVSAAHFTLGLLWLTLAWSTLSRVSRTVHVDCTMATLELQQERLELELFEAMQQRHTVVDTLRLRMAALDRSLDQLNRDASVLSGPEGLEKLKREHMVNMWRFADTFEVDRELRRVKEHAMQVLYQLIRHKDEAGGKLSALQQRVRGELTLEDQRLFEEHLKSLFASTEEAVRRLHAHEERKRRVSGDEYSEILRNMDRAVANTAYVIQKIEEKLGSTDTPLTHAEAMQLLTGLDPGGAVPASVSALQQARMKEPAIAGALKRQDTELYDTEHIVQDVEETRRAWQKKWEGELASPNLFARTAGYIERLPARCHAESGAGKRLMRLLSATLVLHLGCLYLGLGQLRREASMRLPSRLA